MHDERSTARLGQGPRRGSWWALGLVVGTMVGCLRVAAFECQQDPDCVHDGMAGQCQADTGLCLYPDQACDTRWSTASGECMPGGAGGSSTGAPVAESGDSGESGAGSSGSTGAPGADSTTGTVDLCGTGSMMPLTDLGVVQASSVYSDNFHAFLAADGDLATSWFSSGPEPGNLPSTFTWTVLDPHCIEQLTLTGNGLHQNPAFRESFGFESVVVRVYDEHDEIVFQQMTSLAGTPDPTVVVEPRVTGVRIELELSEHESSDCGGFGELEILGR